MLVFGKLRQKLESDTERGRRVDPETWCLPDGSICAHVLEKILGFIPETVIRLDEGSNSYPLLIFDSVNRKKWKLFQAHSEKNAIDIVRATRIILEKNVAIPEIRGTAGSFVLAEWIDGVPLKNELPFRSLINEVAAYQASIHGAFIEGPSKADCFTKKLFDWINNKRPTLLSFLQEKEFREMLLLLEAESPKNLAKGIRHTDIRLFNLVRAENGRIYSIDNADLSFGMGFESDIFKTLYYSFSALPWHIPGYLAEALTLLPQSTILEAWNFWNLLYFIKEAIFEIEVKKGKHARKIKNYREKILGAIAQKRNGHEVLVNEGIYNKTKRLACFLTERNAKRE